MHASPLSLSPPMLCARSSAYRRPRLGQLVKRVERERRDGPSLFSQFVELLLRLVQVLGRSVLVQQEIIADEYEIRFRWKARMDREVHIGGERHGFIGAQQWPFHKIIALAVAIEAQLRRCTAAFHIVVMAGIDLRT